MFPEGYRRWVMITEDQEARNRFDDIRQKLTREEILIVNAYVEKLIESRPK